MNDKPNITVVIPTYNRKDQLKRCLESLRDQSIGEHAYEIIIVDDGSTDETSHIGRMLMESGNGRIKYYYQENKGPAAARNFGVSKARGEFVAFLDDDCQAEKNWLEELIKGYEDNQVVGTGGRVLSPLRNTLADYYCAHVGLLETPKIKMQKVQYVVSANASFRKANLEEIGGFDESFPFPGGEEPDLCFRLTKMGYRFLYNRKAVVFHFHPRTFRSINRTYYNYGLGKALFMLKNKKGIPSFLYEILSLGWFFLLALKNLPFYVWATRGWKGITYSFFDVYIRLVFRIGLIVGYFRYRLFYRG